MKVPPIEKIAEAYTAIVDGRVTLLEDYANVKSSNWEKEYLIKWKDGVYYSNDNSTYWQGYVGYPVIAVLMLQGKLHLNMEVAKFFKGINWNKLNKENKRDYKKSLDKVLENYSEFQKKNISDEIEYVFEELKNMDITLTRKKNLD